MAIGRERAALLLVWGLAALACLLGLIARPSFAYDTSAGAQLLDLLRVLCTACLALTLLLGPGVVWRAFAGGRQPSLAFLCLPGLALLAAAGVLVWALAGEMGARLACFLVFGPLLGLMLGTLVGAGPEDLFEREEQRVLLIVGCALGFAIAKSVWSLGPEGELYAGTISRTLEVGDRSDSRISYLIPQFAAQGTGPYSELANSYLFPYNFSTRGPIPGLASAPVVFLSGAQPQLPLPDQPWRPFDPEGFMAYRLAMMTFACTAFLSVWDLTRRLGGLGAARLALVLAVTTPFLLHEVWFTWPKLFGASLVLMAGICIVERKALRSGLLVGVGYLMHPGALLSLSGLGLLALWPLRGADWRRPQIKSALLMIAGVAVSLIAWRLVNGSHFAQSDFVDYLRSAGSLNPYPSPGEWLTYRADSLGNTLVPMLLPLFYGKAMTINVVEGTSPFSIHFFFQYWNTLPFGIGIVFFPLLLISLWRAWRLWKWPVFAAVAAPFIAFALYWGASRTGMLREGLQAWVLVLLAVVALQQRRAGFPWLRSRPIRAILGLRAVELLLVALGPALITNHLLVSDAFQVSDTLALLAMVGFATGLGALAWSTTPARLERVGD